MPALLSAGHSPVPRQALGSGQQDELSQVLSSSVLSSSANHSKTEVLVLTATLLPLSSSTPCQNGEPPARAPSPGWETRREMCPSRCEIFCCFSPRVFSPARSSSGAYLAKCLNEQRSVGLALGPIEFSHAVACVSHEDEGVESSLSPVLTTLSL